MKTSETNVKLSAFIYPFLLIDIYCVPHIGNAILNIINSARNLRLSLLVSTAFAARAVCKKDSMRTGC